MLITAKCLSMSYYIHSKTSSCQSDIESSWVGHEADTTCVVGTHSGDDDHIFLPSLEAVHSVAFDVQKASGRSFVIYHRLISCEVLYIIAAIPTITTDYGSHHSNLYHCLSQLHQLIAIGRDHRH